MFKLIRLFFLTRTLEFTSSGQGHALALLKPEHFIAFELLTRYVKPE